MDVDHHPLLVPGSMILNHVINYAPGKIYHNFSDIISKIHDTNTNQF